MPSEAPLVPNLSEKPHHYMYLKEFRTQQCDLFLQHKCQQHRPFTCFHWHFLNQRRRRPVRKRDGTFSYSPDIYCTKYDENTGICPDGDECPFLHRTAGDTERRYHLRYYKTGTCVYDTDSKGHCSKNGAHCAFAHGAHDMRPPVYDSTEMQPSIEFLDKASSSPSSEKDKVLAEDPRWNDTNFVLANYKTEPCKRPPRLCRQGYACPQFHNTRDRRRSPKLYKYRSTPCPNVKHGDEWGDPTHCESGDNCSYCHTRTEQQFHPEIYKSTKCNDMVQTKFCPRGAFCAFAHVEQITSVRDVLSISSNSLAAFVTNVLPQNDSVGKLESISGKDAFHYREVHNGKCDSKLPDPIGKERANSTPVQPSLIQMNLLASNNGSAYRNSPLHDPFMKARSCSVSSDYALSPLYMRAPGFERDEYQLKLRQQLMAIEKDPTLDSVEKAKRKENLILVHQSGLYSHLANSMGLTQGTTSMSPLAPAFYPPGDCVESVIGKALDDVNLEDLDIGSLERELDKDMDTNSVSSSLSAGLSTSGCFSNNSSIPIGIPPSAITQRGSISSLSQSPPSPFGSFPHSMQPLLLHKQDSNDHSSSPLLNCYQGLTKYQMGSNLSDTNSMSPRSAGPQSPMLSGSFSGHVQNGEVQKLRDELMMARSKMAEWEGVYTQAKSACEAWKKEAEDANKKAKSAEEERMVALKHKDEVMSQNQRLQQMMSGGPHIHAISRSNEMDKIPVQQLQQYRVQLQNDLELLDKLIYQKVQQNI
ncbi:RING finger protein unkempt homolog isoform X2 [Aplysia californica]|uniref:RING finger protein unkempt homolog isoform X2 n=1 Tax=Aplysia californica TaxID=6500 RepID=A0ABM1VZC8_APLCA|nr:RING finger protein unkempt homolog isoform X2 [Aplysia californica]